jgi:hypothetical protein
VDESPAIGFFPLRFDRALPQIVDQCMSENAVEPGYCILTTPQRRLAFYGSENTLLKEVLRNAVIHNSFPQKRQDGGPRILDLLDRILPTMSLCAPLVVLVPTPHHDLTSPCPTVRTCLAPTPRPIRVGAAVPAFSKGGGRRTVMNNAG